MHFGKLEYENEHHLLKQLKLLFVDALKLQDDLSFLKVDRFLVVQVLELQQQQEP